MKRIFIIIAWELRRHLKARNFWLATFLSPLLMAGLAQVPSLFVDNAGPKQSQIGFVEFDSTSYFQALTEHLTDSLHQTTSVLLVLITPDTSERMRREFEQLARLKHELDSLNEAYNKIKERRRYIFQRPDSRTRRKLLSDSYDQLISTREQRDLAEIEYTRMKNKTDALVRQAVLHKADSLLAVKEIEGYIVLEDDSFKQGVIRFHAAQPINFLRIQPLKQALQVMLVEERMKEQGITVNQIQELLEPIQFHEIISEGSVKREFKVMVTYLAPVIAVLLLCISIFTTSGFLFSAIVVEKANKILQWLLSYVSSFQVITGKIMGLGIVGLLQIFIWLILTMVLMAGNVLPTEDIGFLTLRNAGLLVLYFVLGYLFFASLFTGVGALSSSQEDAHRLKFYMRLLSLLPIVLAVFVLHSPDSLFVRILSFIPFLAPIFMILRTPLGQPPLIDYYISCGVLVVSIVLSFMITGKLFRNASVIYGKKTTLKLVLNLLREK